jgi:beta-lactam-binding protein with PASTA domain
VSLHRLDPYKSQVPGGIMSPRVSHQHDRRRMRPRVVVAVAALLATTLAATPQQETTATTRAKRAPMQARITRDTSGKVNRPPSDMDDVQQSPPQRQKPRRPSGPADAQQPRPPRRMPSLLGMDTLRALDTLRKMDLPRHQILLPRADTIPIDVIVDQIPRPGSTQLAVDVVRLKLGGRPRPTKSVPLRLIVPDVVGLTQREATRLLSVAMLAPQSSSAPATSSIEIGRVLQQQPRGGQSAVRGSRVAIVVGRDARVTMPRVTGRTLASATSALRKAGLLRAPTVRRVAGAGAPLDSVVRQSPARDTRVWPGTGVALSMGRRSVPPALVPYVVGLDSTAAIRKLRAAGLSSHRVALSSRSELDLVVGRQSPVAGQRVPRPTTVVLTLSPRIPEVIVPSVVDMSVDSATHVLTDSGFVVRVDEWRWASRLRGTVRSQSPRAGIPVIRAARVTIVPDTLRAEIVLLVVVLGGGLAAYMAARTIWPPPTVTPRISLQPLVAQLAHADGRVVVAAVSIRSHLEHQPSTYHPIGAPLA